MSTVEDVRPIGQQPAERRPLRALALVVTSRLVIGLGVVAATWSVHVVSSTMDAGATDGRTLTFVEHDAGVPAGASVASVLEDVGTRITREGGSLISLDLTRRSGASADIGLTVDLPGSGVAAVDRFVASIGRSELDNPSPRSVDPVPSATRVTIDASVALLAVPLGDGVGGEQPAAIALAAAAERAEVELRRVDIPGRAQDPARLVASGGLTEIVALVDVVEREHSAPQRFRSVSLRRTPANAYEVVMTFGLREDVLLIPPEVGP